MGYGGMAYTPLLRVPVVAALARRRREAGAEQGEGEDDAGGELHGTVGLKTTKPGVRVS